MPYARNRRFECPLKRTRKRNQYPNFIFYSQAHRNFTLMLLRWTQKHTRCMSAVRVAVRRADAVALLGAGSATSLHSYLLKATLTRTAAYIKSHRVYTNIFRLIKMNRLQSLDRVHECRMFVVFSTHRGQKTAYTHMHAQWDTLPRLCVNQVLYQYETQWTFLCLGNSRQSNWMHKIRPLT